jgi:polyisoprenoid-binding protein YceI
MTIGKHCPVYDFGIDTRKVLAMKLTLISASLVVFAAPALAVDNYTIDPRHTYPVFEVSHLGFSTQRGRFNKTSGKIVLDPQTSSGSIEVTIEAASIDMGLDGWNKQMRSEEFFNSDAFPAITFKSTKVSFDSQNEPVAAEGEITMLGVTRPMTLKLTSFKCGVNPANRKYLCGADVVTTLKRSEFGIKKYLPYIPDDIKIMIAVEAFKD